MGQAPEEKLRMIDPFVILAPILLLAVVALLQFVGCNWAFGIHETVETPPVKYVQVGSKDAVPSDPLTVITDPFGMDVTSGNLLVLWIWYDSAMSHVSDVSDGVGNTYSPAVPPMTGVAGLANWRQEIWYAHVVTGGSLRITANFDPMSPFTAKKAIFAHEYAGLDASAPFETGTAAAGPATPMGMVVTVSSGTVMTAGKLVFGAALFSPDGSGALGFTQRTAPDGNVSEDQFPTMPGLVDATFSTKYEWIAQVATFK
jgi:hypothetical protein